MVNGLKLSSKACSSLTAYQISARGQQFLDRFKNEDPSHIEVRFVRCLFVSFCGPSYFALSRSFLLSFLFRLPSSPWLDFVQILTVVDDILHHPDSKELLAVFWNPEEEKFQLVCPNGRAIDVSRVFLYICRSMRHRLRKDHVRSQLRMSTSILSFSDIFCSFLFYLLNTGSPTIFASASLCCCCRVV